MKRLDFTRDGGAQHYTMIYDGIINSPRPYKAPVETRVISKVLNKLEAIGRPYSVTVDVTSFKLTESGGIVLLEDEEYRIAHEALHQTQWNARGARGATEATEWFDAAPVHMNEQGLDSETKVEK